MSDNEAPLTPEQMLEEAEKQKAFRRLTAYKTFFESPSGREVIQCLRESLDGDTFHPDPYAAAYKAGRRSVYLDIMQTVENAHEAMAALAPEKTVTHLQARAELPATIEEL